MEKKIIRQLTTPIDGSKETLCYVYKQFGNYAVHCPLFGVHCVFAYANEQEAKDEAMRKYWLYVEKVLAMHFYNSLTEEGLTDEETSF